MKLKIGRIINIINFLSKLNLYKRYKEYKNIINELEKHNTMDIDKFMKKSPEAQIMTLYSLITPIKIKQDLQMKLLFIILFIVCGSGGISAISMI